MSLADRWPHVMEIENSNVHNSAASTARTVNLCGRPVERARLDHLLPREWTLPEPETWVLTCGEP